MRIEGDVAASHVPAAAKDYIIPFATSKQIYSATKARIFRQAVAGYNYYIELYFYELKRSLALEVLFPVPCVIFCHTLSGRARSQAQNSGNVIDVVAGWYGGHYNRPGSYRIKLTRGTHAFFCFTVENAYLHRILGNYPTLNTHVRSLLSADTIQLSLPARPINFSIKRTIKRMQRCSGVGIEQEAALLGAIGDLLSVYDNDLQSNCYQTPPEIIYEVRDYIFLHYTEPDVYHIPFLAEKFGTTERTLSRVFKHEFNITIRQLIIKLRMEKAAQLLSAGNNVNKVSQAVGYRNNFSFSKVFKKYYSCTPQSVKTGRIPHPNPNFSARN